VSPNLQELGGRDPNEFDVLSHVMASARPRMSLAAPLVLVLACLAVVPAAQAQNGSSSKVKVATTGNRSELVETIPITKKPLVSPRVVMSLGPAELGPLQSGDQLEVNAEAEITTDCRFASSECVGQPYDFNPKIGASLVVATSPSTAAGLVLSPRQEVNCRQKLPNRQHHCVFTLQPPSLQVDLAALPCPASGCYVNLVMDAYHRKGSPKRNVVLVGANNRNGKVKQDKGRVNAIRTRPPNPAEVPPPAPLGTLLIGTDAPVTNALSLNPEGEAVIYSQQLDGLVNGDQISVKAGLTTDVALLNHNANVSTRIVLADDALGTDPGVIGAEVTDLKGEITENNGFNCTKKATPCPSVKLGVITLKKNANAPLFVNLVLNISGFGHAAPGTFLPIPPAGGIEVTRYPASANG